ncbi:succinate-semialdehyde dehydrogenase [Viridothelium virens]|uniref:Succinate-semialdehyde dehydrogenase, mitochondrial n=1 Tax=Viridothelium virens TaxID=1048519 RepID=A0A6A6HAQ5_VIRVR|nr:succinate-semialdehyde dehydrogenase [Viridothelium virens]
MSVLKKQIPYTFKDPSLLDTRSFIGGEWVSSSSNKTFPAYDPEDDALAAEITDLTRPEIHNAISTAHTAFQTYRHVPPRQRRFMLRAWSDAIKAHASDLAAICTLELGKPFTESLGTVAYAVSFLDWFETLTEHVRGESIVANRADNRIVTVREPQGVVAAVTPWNSPVAMITRKVGAAIAAGNTVVVKPAPETPLCAIALAKLFERCGFPSGVLNVVTCSAETTAECGAEMCENRLVRHLSFTGSTAVGMWLHSECAKTLKRTSMELGGNAPFIVFEDADVEKAVEGLITSKFRSSGQTCVCANRVLVHESVIEAFSKQLLKRIPETLVAGSVWDKKTSFGPLYSSKGVAKVKRHFEDALKQGATLLTGGLEDEKGRGPNFIPPTALRVSANLTSKTSDLAFSSEETFGPMVALIPFKTEEEAIRYANETNAGLASYFYTKDASRQWRVAEALESGMVGVQVGLVSACEQPFGGIKQSGIGREGGSTPLEEYTEIKSITFGV